LEDKSRRITNTLLLIRKERDILVALDRSNEIGKTELTTNLSLLNRLEKLLTE